MSALTVNTFDINNMVFGEAETKQKIKIVRRRMLEIPQKRETLQSSSDEEDEAETKPKIMIVRRK